jgi:hypothetical protein
MVNLQLYFTTEYIDFIKSLHYPSLKTTLPHESIQHLSEILNYEENSNLIYLIFNIDYFGNEILKLNDFSTIKYLPDGVLFNKELGIIESKMQFKTYFSVKPLTESKLNTLNINYSTF